MVLERTRLGYWPYVALWIVGVGGIAIAAYGVYWRTAVGQPDPASQAFIDCGTTMPRYDDGSDLICRPDGRLVAAIPTPGNEGPAGWGVMLGTCEVDCECYCDGGKQFRQSGCVVYVYPFDADGDGRLTLRDYQEFQNAFGQ